MNDYKLTDEQIDAASPAKLESQHWFTRGARWAEAAATAPLLERIAALEQRNADLYEDVQRFKGHAMNEKDARMALERELEGVRKDALSFSDDGDALTIAYLHGIAKGKDAALTPPEQPK